MVIHFMNTFRVQNRFYILPLYFVTIRIWEPKPRKNKVLTYTFKIYQISVNYLDITIYTGLRFSNCHKLHTKSLIIPLNNFQILSQKKRIYSHIRHSKNTNDLSTLNIIFNDFKGHLSKRKKRYSENENKLDHYEISGKERKLLLIKTKILSNGKHQHVMVTQFNHRVKGFKKVFRSIRTSLKRTQHAKKPYFTRKLSLHRDLIKSRLQ